MSKMSTTHYDLIIIGAGPSGLAAAVYTAREGISTLVLDKGIVGGLAAITAQIDNYPGFDKSISGLQLADRLSHHAQRFGAQFKTGVTVTSLFRSQDKLHLGTSAGNFTADSVLIASGSSYKYLDVSGEKEHIGHGVHFCATCDAPLYRGKDITVIGGGNSAVQESLFIAKFARQVTLLVRGPELTGTKVIREQLQALPNVKLKFNTEVKQINGDGTKVTSLDTYNTFTGKRSTLPTAAIFVFIGLKPSTDAFIGTVELDARGFIVTQANFTTNVPGIFAAGDVRSGATWQIASAIGEGVSASLSIRRYLYARAHTNRHASRTKVPAA